MKIYLIKVGLSGPISQPELIDLLENAGCDSIQTSDGLCVKSNQEINALKQLHDVFQQLPFQVVDPSNASQIKDLSPDVIRFITSNTSV